MKPTLSVKLIKTRWYFSPASYKVLIHSKVALIVI